MFIKEQAFLPFSFLILFSVPPLLSYPLLHTLFPALCTGIPWLFHAFILYSGSVRKRCSGKKGIGTIYQYDRGRRKQRWAEVKWRKEGKGEWYKWGGGDRGRELVFKFLPFSSFTFVGSSSESFLTRSNFLYAARIPSNMVCPSFPLSTSLDSFPLVPTLFHLSWDSHGENVRSFIWEREFQLVLIKEELWTWETQDTLGGESCLLSRAFNRTLM